MNYPFSNTAYGTDGGVVFLTARKARRTLNGLRASDKNGVIGVIDYPRLAVFSSFRASVLIVCDIERMAPAYEERLSKIIASWKEQPRAPLILNQPPKTLRRFELLKRLYKSGVNKKDVHRLDDPYTIEKTGFPCFIRDEAGHHLTPVAPHLLHTRDELLAETEKLHQSGASAFGKIVVEFEDTRDSAGLYSKFASFRVANTHIPAHRFWSSDWFVKHIDPGLLSRHPELARRELEFVQSAPHNDALSRIFDVAGIEFGRIDYGIRQDGGIHVFEINTNPNHPHPEAVAKERKETLETVQKGLVSALEELAEKNTCVRLRWPGDELIYRLQNQI